VARRRPNRTTTAVTVVAAALALLPGAGLASASPAARASSGDDRSALVREILSRTRGQARIAHDQRSGRVTFVGAGKARAVTRPSDVPASGSADAAARAYLRHLAPLTGVGEQAVRSPEVLDQPWGSTVHYEQTSGGVPVFGGEVTVSLDRSHQLTAYAASTTDTTVHTTPTVTSARAADVALRTRSRALHLPVGALHASTPTLAVYDSRLLGVPGQRTQALVWRTEVTATGRPDVRELVLVDARLGVVALHFSEVDHESPDRRVCDDKSVPDKAKDDTDSPCQPADYVRTESTDTSANDADVAAAFDNAGKTFAFYRDVLGATSLLGSPSPDGPGTSIVSSVHYCPESLPAPYGGIDCQYPNAFWSGAQMVYGTGMPQALDVVAHELTHGVTQHTSGLYYFFQSGAINESMSDVMGELVEQSTSTSAEGDPSNWLIGQSLPDDSRGIHDLRSMKDPTFASFVPTVPNESHGSAQPDRMTSSLWDPGVDSRGLFDAGGVHENSGVGNKAAYLITEGTYLEPNASFGSFPGMSDNAGLTLSHRASDGTPDADRAAILGKVANLYYAVERMLPATATYADLGAVLPQACNALVAVGTIERGVDNRYTYRASDCATVQHAVDATAMSQAPTSAGANPRPEAPTCTNGGSQTVAWSDDFESPSTSVTRWAVNPAPTADGGAAWYPDPTALTVAPDAGAYPHAGRGNLWGDDPDGNGVARELTAEPVLGGTKSSPAGLVPDASTYLRFAHFYSFEQDDDTTTGQHEYYDGGQVQYSVYDAVHKTWSTWADAGSLFSENGYTGTISPAYDNKHAGQRAFVGASPGYTASRLYLGGFAGKPVRVRFVIEADSAGGDYGWYVDDVKVYSCNATSLSVNRPTIRFGQSTSVSGALTVAGTNRWINGATVILSQQRPGTTSWSRLTSTRTSSYGNYSFAGFKPAQNWNFRVEYAGSSPFAGTSSSTTVYVAPTVSVTASSTSFRLGGTVTLSGTVSPNHHGQYVYLQRYLGSGRWTTVTSGVLSSSSTYALPWKPTARAAYVLRVVKNPDSDHAGATSSNVTIHVS